MSFISGVGSQTLRNLTFEPWRGNTRSADSSTRRGEITADTGFMVGGGFVGIKGIQYAIQTPSIAGKIGAAAVAGLALTGAAVGVTNLFAKLPKDSEKPGTGNGNDKLPENKFPDNGKTPDTGKTPGKDHLPDKGQIPGNGKLPEKGQLPGNGQLPPELKHIVRSGENLSFIADCNDLDWRDLYSFNRDSIGANPDLIRAGQELLLPPRDYKGEPFNYQPTAKPGLLPAGLECTPTLPHENAACK